MRKTEHLSLRSFLLELTVEQVVIEIKFPCTISVSLKIGRDEVFSEEEAKPIDSRVSLSQRLQLRCSLVYDSVTRKYTDKKAAIHVHVNSLTGRNTAGLSKLNLVDLVSKTPTELMRAPLERCPARNAEIAYRMSVRFEGELPYQQLSVDNGSIDAKHSDGGSRGQQSRVREGIEYPKDQQPSFGGYLRKGDSKDGRDIKDKDLLSSSSAGRHRILDELDDDSAKRPKHRTTTNSGFRPPSFQTRQPPFKETEAFQVEHHVPTVPPLAPSSILRVRTPSAITSNEAQLEAQRKVARLEAQRQNQTKLIASLNSQIQLHKAQLLNRSTKESELISEIEKLKRRVDSQDIQLENSKKAKVELERQLSTKLLEQKNSVQLQHKLSKAGDLQNQLQQLRRAKEEADRIAKEKQKEYNLLLDRVEDLTNSSATNQKRLEMKDTFYKEEVKKYSEKLVESELQKQKLLAELESLRTSVEDKTRRIDAMTRDRDRLLTDEKGKFVKKIDQMKQDYEALQTKRNQDHQEVLSLSSTVDALRVQNTELSLEKIRFQEEIERLRTKLITEGQYRSKYEQQLKEHSSLNRQKSAIEEQLQADRLDKEQAIQRLSEELAQREEQSKQLSHQLAQLQKLIKQKQGRITDQQFEIESLKKKLDASKRSELRKADELAELQQSMEGYIQVENNKKHEVMGAVQRYEQEVQTLTETLSRLSDEHDAMKREHKYELEQLKLSSSSQIDQLREACQQFQKAFEQAQSAKQTVQLQLNHELLKLNESGSKVDEMRIENDNLSNLVFDLRNQIKDKQLQLQEIDQQLWDKKDQLQAANTTIEGLTEERNKLAAANEELQTRLDLLKEDGMNQQSIIDKLRSDLTSEVQLLSADRDKYQSRSRELAANVERLSLEVERLEGLLSIKTIDKETLEGQYDALKKDCERLNQQNELIKADLRDTMTETEQTVGKADQLNKLLRETQQSYEQLSLQNYNFKIAIDDFAKVLGEFVSGQEILTADQIEQKLAAFKDLPFTLTATLTHFNEARIRQDFDLKEATIQRSNLQNDIAKLNEQMSSKLQEQISIQQDLTSKNDQLYLTVENLRQEQANIESNLHDVTNKLDAAIRDSESIELQKSELKARLLEVLTQFDTTKANYDHVEAQLISKEAEVQILGNQLTGRLNELATLREKGYSEQSEMYRSLQTAKLKTQEDEQQLARLKDQMETKQKTLTEEVSRLVSERDIKSARIGQLQSSLAERQAAIEDLTYKWETAVRKERENAEKLMDSSRKMIEQQSELERQNLNVMALSNSIKDFERKCLQLEKEKESQQKRIGQLVDEVSNCEFMLTTMKSDLQTTQQELDDTADNMRRKQEERAILEEELSSKSKTNATLNQQISKLKDLVYRINRAAEDKEGESAETTRQSLMRLGAAEKELQAITAERNSLREKLKEQQNMRLAAKKAFDKEKEQFVEEKSKLQAQAMQLNEQIYSISSDVNTMRLREQEDQENLQKLQNQLSALASMYVAQKKKNDQLEQTQYYSNSDRSDKMENEVRQLRGQNIRNIEQIRKLSAEINYLHQKLLDNPELHNLQEKMQDIKRDYNQELAILQEIINRERKDCEIMRRQYHQKCIGYQQKIRLLEVQFRNEREHDRDMEDRLETIQEEKSSTMSEIGAAQNQHIMMTSPDRPIQFNTDSDLQMLREQLKQKQEELMACALKIQQMENVIAHYESNGQLVALQEQLKCMVTQKLYFMSKISEILTVVMRIKSKSVEYSDFTAEASEILNEFRVLQSKLIEISEHSIHLEEIAVPNELNTQSRSTGIVDSSSQNSHEFDKIKHSMEADPESIAGLANRLKANLSSYRN